MTAQLNSERAISEILSHFNSNFIRDVMEDCLMKKFRPYGVGTVNYPTVLERDFITTLNTNPSFEGQINEVRSETYREIISMICSYYNLRYTGEDTEVQGYAVLYSTAAAMYDIFVSNFSQRMIQFFVRLIINNKTTLYDMITANDKKDVDSAYYSKKMYTDHELVIVHSNMDQVLDLIAGMDIPIGKLLTYLADSQVAAYLSDVLEDCGDIYKYHYARYIMDPATKPDMFTTIKLNIQQYAVNLRNPGNIIKKEDE